MRSRSESDVKRNAGREDDRVPPGPLAVTTVTTLRHVPRPCKGRGAGERAGGGPPPRPVRDTHSGRRHERRGGSVAPVACAGNRHSVVAKRNAGRGSPTPTRRRRWPPGNPTSRSPTVRPASARTLNQPPRPSTCKARFPERKATPLYDARLPADTAVAVLAHVAEGVGTRKTTRLTGVHPDTVTRYVCLGGDHAERLHERRVGGFFPRRRLRPSLTRSGRSSAIRRRTAGRMTPATGAAVTTWPSTRRAGWSSASWSISGRRGRPTRW